MNAAVLLLVSRCNDVVGVAQRAIDLLDLALIDVDDPKPLAAKARVRAVDDPDLWEEARKTPELRVAHLAQLRDLLFEQLLRFVFAFNRHGTSLS